MHLCIRMEIAVLKANPSGSNREQYISESEKQNPRHKYLFPTKTLPELVKQWEGRPLL